VAELEKYEYATDGELVVWLGENCQVFNTSEMIERLSAVIE
jgi:hypothetical protein